MMMIADMMGFCLGLEGVKQMISDLFPSAQGWMIFLGCLGALFVCAQVQFEAREVEKRRGVFLNC